VRAGGLEGPIEEGEEDEEEEDEDEDDNDGRSDEDGGFRRGGSGVFRSAMTGADAPDSGVGDGEQEDNAEDVEEGAAPTSGSAPSALVASGAAAAVTQSGVATVDAPAAVSPLPPSGPGLHRLWSYFTPAVEGLNVSAMDWNKSFKDLLAVGYGPYDLASAHSGSKGLVALWAITNPEHPQAILRTPDDTGVTAIAFSTAHPNLLAAGLYDGSICVWDTRHTLHASATSGLPAMVSDQLLPGAHSEAVWGIKWVPKNELGEVLVSVSTDGCVTQWDTKKGLAPTPIMTLKRARTQASASGGAAMDPASTSAGSPLIGENDGGAVGGPSHAVSSAALGAAGSEGLLSRTASGLTIDFVKEDPSQYFVGASHLVTSHDRFLGCHSASLYFPTVWQVPRTDLWLAVARAIVNNTWIRCRPTLDLCHG
jgi:hypothetical protein